MANMFPNNPVGTLAPEVLRVFRVLKRLPDTYAVWMRLNATSPYEPHFWLLRRDGRSLLLSVASATTSEVRNARQGSLFASATFASSAQPGAIELQQLQAYLLHLSEQEVPLGCLPGAVAFPAVSQNDIQRNLEAAPPHCCYLSQEDLSTERFALWLEAQLGPVLSIPQRLAIRRTFVPEIIIPAALTVRVPANRAVQAGVSEYLLSYNQEWILKHDLDLSDEAEPTSTDLQVRLVSGVAGSGKSLVLLYRARLLRQFFPHKRMLVLTHNRPLINDLERRYHRISNSDRSIEWRTFLGWCHKYWPEYEPRMAVVRTKERRELIRQAWHAHLADTQLSPELLQDEIDWVKDRLITTREGYLRADRAGRGFRLADVMRERVFAAIVHYQDALQAQQQLDFGDVPRRIWRGMLEQRTNMPRYDFILIDEAQFFAPIWFEILKQVLTPQLGHLFLVADPTQGFLKRQQSWLASGLEVRGRTHRLTKCYRTTRAIMQFASRYYQSRLPDDSEAMIAADLQVGDDGIPPQIVEVSSEQDELTRVVNEIRALAQSGVPLSQLMVIHAEWQGAERLRERLANEFGNAQAINPRMRNPGEGIRVCTLDSATGLESPIVFLVGTHRLHEAEGSLRLSIEERNERVRDNTRRLYMAMTRAGQRLVITAVGTAPKEFQLAQVET